MALGYLVTAETEDFQQSTRKPQIPRTSRCTIPISIHNLSKSGLPGPALPPERSGISWAVQEPRITASVVPTLFFFMLLWCLVREPPTLSISELTIFIAPAT